jgi:uncharacterized membrane protein YeiH
MTQFIYILELIGTIAFAFSGAMMAIKKELDVFGVLIVAVVTAVGGGVIRDILLGYIPPKMFLSPSYVVVAALTAIIVFIWIYKRRGQMESEAIVRVEKIMLYADTIGLAVFTVIGVKAAFEVLEERNLFLSVFVGVMTGVGGGVLRDVLVGLKPYIFVKHVYALSSVIGAVLCAFLWCVCNREAGVFFGAGAVIVLRLLAIRFEWNLPKINLGNTEENSSSL